MDNIETMDIKTIAKMAGLKYNTVFKTLQKNKIEPADYTKGKNNKKVSLYYVKTLPAKILEAIEANRETNQDNNENIFTFNEPAGDDDGSNDGGGSDENNDDSGETLDLDESTEMTAGDEYLPNPCVKYLTSDLIGWFVQLYGEETTKTILANDYGIGI